MRGAYFVQASFGLASGAQREWHMAADVSQDAAAVVHRAAWLGGARADLIAELERDLTANTNLSELDAKKWVDAIQDMPWPVEACELETVVDNDTVGTVPIFICLQIQD